MPSPVDPKEEKNWKEEAVSFFRTLITILLIALGLRTCVIEPFKIPSGSMKPTLQIGDYILVLKFWYGLRLPFVTDSVAEWNEPKHGDVVVFTRPDDPRTPDRDDSEIHIIKRVVALPGDTVEVTAGSSLGGGRGSAGQLLVNGQPVAEPYARWVEGGAPEGRFGPKIVPPGHVLLLGDNRDQSQDSRFWTDPFLDMRRIKGKAVLIFWSWDKLSRIGTVIR